MLEYELARYMNTHHVVIVADFNERTVTTV